MNLKRGIEDVLCSSHSEVKHDTHHILNILSALHNLERIPKISNLVPFDFVDPILAYSRPATGFTTPSQQLVPSQ